MPSESATTVGVESTLGSTRGGREWRSDDESLGPFLAWFESKMSVVLLLLVVGATLVAFVLFTPIAMNASCIVNEDELGAAMELSWGRHLATARIGSGGDGRLHVFRIPTVRLSSLFESRKDSQRERRFPKLRRVDLRVLRSMLGQSLRALHPTLHVHGVIGLGDPADTAIMLTGLRYVERVAGDRVRLEILDDVLEDTTQLVGRIDGWVLPAEIAGMFILWIVRSDTRRVLLGR